MAIPIYLTTFLPTHRPTFLPFLPPSFYLPTFLPYLPTYLPTFLPTYLPLYLPTYLPTYPPTYLPCYDYDLPFTTQTLTLPHHPGQLLHHPDFLRGMPCSLHPLDGEQLARSALLDGLDAPLGTFPDDNAPFASAQTCRGVRRVKLGQSEAL